MSLVVHSQDPCNTLCSSCGSLEYAGPLVRASLQDEIHAQDRAFIVLDSKWVGNLCQDVMRSWRVD